MKSASHHAMGHLLYEALTAQGVQLDRELFVLGNLLPDYMPELILNPHFTLKCQREIHIFTEALAGQPVVRGEQLPPEYTLRLGILCHYLTDYFTFAHTPGFSLGLKEHGAYELRLNDYFRTHYTQEESTLQSFNFGSCENARDVVREIYRLKRDYCAEGCTLSRDVKHAFSACLGSIRELVAISEEREEHARAKRRISFFTAERYAFKDAVCTRRITPRKAWCPIAACV
ncbi:MAG TPA: zinc dependent phospholipase C family protein [Clostridia bacterium]|nr:zinc dependent phospholipase C family protein [Clostridia bacterium]